MVESRHVRESDEAYGFMTIDVVEVVGKGMSIPEGVRIDFDPEEDENRGFIVSQGDVAVIAKAENVEPLLAEFA